MLVYKFHPVQKLILFWCEPFCSGARLHLQLLFDEMSHVILKDMPLGLGMTHWKKQSYFESTGPGGNESVFQYK